jgi:hypothetical protein
VLELRLRLSALALVTVVAATNGAAVLAAAQQPAPCVTQHHACDKTTAIRPCCCDPHGDVSNQGGPIESRVQIGADVSAVPLVLAAVTLDGQAQRSGRVNTSPPRIVPLDLPTLFATLLI